MAAPACPALIFLGTKVGTDLIGTVEFGKAQAGRTLTLPDIHLTFIDDTAIDASLSEPTWLTSVVLSTITKVDPGDGVTKAYLQGVFTIPVADVNLGVTYHGTYTYSDGFQTSSAQDFCIIPAFFLPLAYIGDQANGIWSFDLANVRASLTKIITTAGTGANPGRITWDNVRKKLLFLDARGGDVALHVYEADDDGTNIVKLSGATSSSTTLDNFDGVMFTSNGRIAYHTTNQKGIMNSDGAGKNSWSTSNFDKRDMAATGTVDEVYNMDGDGNPLDYIDYETGVITQILAAPTGQDVVSDREDFAATEVFYRVGKTLRKVLRDGTGDAEIYAGGDITNMQVVIGIDTGRIYFVYDLAGNTHIGSILKAGTGFTDHGRIDDLSATNWNARCGTISFSP